MTRQTKRTFEDCDYRTLCKQFCGLPYIDKERFNDDYTNCPVYLDLERDKKRNANLKKIREEERSKISLKQILRDEKKEKYHSYSPSSSCYGYRSCSIPPL